MSDLAKEKRDVKNFSKIRIRCFAHIEIEQDEEESLVIEAIPSSLTKIKTELYDDTLLFGYTWHAYLWPRRFNAYLRVKNLQGIYFEGAGDVNSELVKTERMEIRISGAGKVKLKLESKEMDVTIYGSGSIWLSGKTEKESIKIFGSGSLFAEDFKSQDCAISISGSGSTKVSAEKKLNIKISGSGSTGYVGNHEITQNIMGAGRIYRIR